MATTNYSWNLPTVGGSEDTWGTQLNANWTALDTLLNGVTQAEISLLKGATSLVPSGVILMWSGSIATIPAGFFLCDGTNGTPDLTGRFVIHADADSGGTYAPGDTGGANDVTLSEAQMPAHTHTVSASGTTSSNGAHVHGSGTLANYGNSNGTFGSGGTLGLHQGFSSGSQVATTSNGAHTHTVDATGTAASTGGGSSHENRPPYYALAYIMKA